MAKLDEKHCLELAMTVDSILLEKKMSRKELIRPGLSKSNLENFFAGKTTTPKTIRKLELVLNRKLLESGGKADFEHGEYTSEEAKIHVGRFIFIRPLFTKQQISTFLVDVRWSDLDSCLVFEEIDRPDKTFTQKGEIFITKDHPFLNLLTLAEGNVRNIVLSFPLKGDSYYRGLMLSLSKPTALSWIPACAPVAMRKIEAEETIELGDFSPAHEQYSNYFSVLKSIEGDFANLRNVA